MGCLLFDRIPIVLKIPQDNKWLYHNGKWFTDKQCWYNYKEVHCPACKKSINSYEGGRDNYCVSMMDESKVLIVICNFCEEKLYLVET